MTVGAVKCVNGVCSSTGQSGAPVAVEQNGEMIFRPQDPQQPKPGEQVYGPKPERVEAGGGSGAPPADAPPERRDVIHPDRDTGPEGPGKHYYHEVFNPAVFPYKRMTALDAIECGANCEEETLVVRDPRLRSLEVGEKRGLYDNFWGSIVVDLEPGKWLPIPTPGAQSVIHTYKVEPPVKLWFAHDSADNLFVQSPTGGRHRLTYMVGVPSSYFGGSLPSGVRLADEPPELLPPIPAATRERVRQFLQRANLRVDRSGPLSRTLDPLVAWFRAFETGDLPPTLGNNYLDLACSQKGCCRHRSYAFAITAMAIGIPARYVENELHVFVEVYVPRVGWKRINLGGALLDEEVLGTDDKTPHQPKGGDPFPQPPAYTKGGAEPPKPQMAEAKGANKSSSESGGGTSGGSSGGTSGGSSGGSNAGSGGGKAAPESRDPGLPYVNLDAPPERAPPKATKKRARTSISIAVASHDTFRGEGVEVKGTVRAEGASAGGLPVEIYLASSAGALRVAGATTAEDGSFTATLEVPRNLPLGDHRVVARTPGDDTRAGSRTH